MLNNLQIFTFAVYIERTKLRIILKEA